MTNKKTMHQIIKYVTSNGREFSCQIRAQEYEQKFEIASILEEKFLGPRIKLDSDEYYQHDPKNVEKFKAALLIQAEAKLKGFSDSIDKIYESRDFAKVHPLSIVGRIFDDSDSPFGDSWNRLCRIREDGREFQQCYYAYHAKPEETENFKQVYP